LATVRAWHDRVRIRATLARVQKHHLIFHPQAELSSLTLTPIERGLVETIRAEGCTLSQLFQMRLADEEIVSSLLYTFAVTRQFAFKGQKKAPMGGRGSAIPISIAPPASTQSAAPMRLSDVNLGAPPSISAANITDTIEPPPNGSDEGERRSEPPSNAGNGGSIVPSATWRAPKITMPPPLTRTERPAPSEGTSEEIGGVEGQLEAMTHFRLAEAALQRGDLAQAERLAQKATHGDPDEVDYAALYIWIRAMGSSSDAAVVDAIGALGKLIDKAPSERTLLYRGKLWKRLKKGREALRDFQRVLEVNPRHREAASEVRLITQSRGK
jgi:tetratricopeptide (TPR) repeat protein